MLAAIVGQRTACSMLGASRATMQRRLSPPLKSVSTVVRRSHRRLSDDERARFLEAAHSDRFCEHESRVVSMQRVKRDVLSAFGAA